MHIEKSDLKPEEIMEGIEALDSMIENIMNQVRAKETECLRSIYTRYCIRYGKMMDFSNVENINEGKNVTSYWIDFGTKEQFLLMRSTFEVVDNMPILKVDFNPALAFNNEL